VGSTGGGVGSPGGDAGPPGGVGVVGVGSLGGVGFPDPPAGEPELPTMWVGGFDVDTGASPDGRGP
jgi:hypothetical protein